MYLLYTQQTHHLGSTLKQRENGRFHVVSTWNPRRVSSVQAHCKYENLKEE